MSLKQIGFPVLPEQAVGQKDRLEERCYLDLQRIFMGQAKGRVSGI